MKTAIITGITGQDGSYLAEFLLGKGYRVIGAKRRASSISTERIDAIYDHCDFSMEYFDLNDVGCMYRLLSKYQPDEFYNLAAQSHVRVSFDVPENTVDGIALGTLRLLEAVRTVSPQTRFYQASSSEMFGDNPEKPQSETTALHPASPYACAKVFAHNLVRNYREGYGIFACSGILFNHESPRRGETFVTRKITLAAARIKLGLQDKLCLGNLYAKRDWGFAGDYVKAMWLMLQQAEPDDFVIATGEAYSVQEFLETVFDQAGLDVDKHVEIDQRLMRPHEVPYLLGDPSKAKERLGWETEVDFKELCNMMYNADLEHISATELREEK
jgi:GDPmannose 4,6-dehydratase